MITKEGMGQLKEWCDWLEKLNGVDCQPPAVIRELIAFWESNHNVIPICRGLMSIDAMKKRLESINKDAWLLSNEIAEARVQAFRDGDVLVAETLMKADHLMGVIHDIVRGVQG